MQFLSTKATVCSLPFASARVNRKTPGVGFTRALHSAAGCCGKVCKISPTASSTKSGSYACMLC